MKNGQNDRLAVIVSISSRDTNNLDVLKLQFATSLYVYCTHDWFNIKQY